VVEPYKFQNLVFLCSARSIVKEFHVGDMARERSVTGRGKKKYKYIFILDGRTVYIELHLGRINL
jgi:hypothetical protein